MNLIFIIFLAQFMIETSTAETIHVYENSSSYAPIHQIGPDRPFEETRIPLLKFIEGAKESLDIEIYEMRVPLIQNALISALKRGIQVRIIGEPDPVGNSCDAFSRYHSTSNQDCYDSFLFTETFLQTVTEYQKKFPNLKKSKIVFFNKNLCYDPIENSPNYCFQHGKMVLRDGKDLLISTGNFNDTSLCLDEKRESGSCNRDFTVIVENSIRAKALNSIFELDFKYSTPCDLPPKHPREGNILRKYTEGRCQEVKEIEINPLDYQTSIVQRLRQNNQEESLTVAPILPASIVKLFEKAQKTISIQAQYLKEPEWHNAIIRAAERGVKIEITLASLCHFNQKNEVGSISYNDYNGETGLFKRFINPLANHPSKKISLKFLNHEIPFSHKGKHSGYLHSKVILIDDKTFWIGSTNGSTMSTHSNREYGIVISDQTMAKKLGLILAHDHQNATSLKEHVPPYTYGETQGVIGKGSCKILPRSFKTEEETLI